MSNSILNFPMTVSVTIDELAESLFEDIMATIVRQISVNSLSRHCALKQFTNDDSRDISSVYPQNPTKDIFGQEKSKLKGSETSRYFECGNCGRKISGGRFALHINKCLDRDRR